MKTKWSDNASESTSGEFEEITEDNNPLHFEALQQSDKRWVNALRLGDRVLWCYEDDDWGWIVMPPRTVESMRSHGKSLIAGTVGRYWDFKKSLYREHVLEVLKLPENASLREICSDNEQLQDLLKRWDDFVDF